MHATKPNPMAQRKDSWRRPVMIIVAMVVLFALVVVFRDEIRVRWWGYRLSQSADVQDRMHYLSLLSGMDAKSLPVARDLIRDPDSANRSFGVALVSTINNDEADRLLEIACVDSDETIRHSAVLGLSMRSSANTVQRLAGLIKRLDVKSAMFAVSRLAGIALPESLDEIVRIARSHPDAGVRAEAIQALGQWGGDDAIAALIDCLSDDAVYSGLTATEAQAREALQTMAPQLALTDATDSGDGQSDLMENRKTNGMRAAEKLRNLTSQEFGYIEGDDIERLAITGKWRAWHEQKRKP